MLFVYRLIEVLESNESCAGDFYNNVHLHPCPGRVALPCRFHLRPPAPARRVHTPFYSSSQGPHGGREGEAVMPGARERQEIGQPRPSVVAMRAASPTPHTQGQRRGSLAFCCDSRSGCLLLPSVFCRVGAPNTTQGFPGGRLQDPGERRRKSSPTQVSSHQRLQGPRRPSAGGEGWLPVERGKGLHFSRFLFPRQRVIALVVAVLGADSRTKGQRGGSWRNADRTITHRLPNAIREINSSNIFRDTGA